MAMLRKRILMVTLVLVSLLVLIPTVTAQAASSVNSVKLSRKSATITLGKSVQLKSYVYPKTAPKRITWTSDDPEIATVSNTGRVKAVSKGKTTITATAENGKKATCKVTVSENKVKSVWLNKKKETVYAGKGFTVKATVKPDNASIKTVKWSSSNEKVATVDKKGRVTGVGAGSAKITATSTSGSKKVSMTVTVKMPVTGVSLSKNYIIMERGKSEKLSWTLEPKNAADKEVSFSSSAPSVVSVDKNGKITASDVGDATVTIKTKYGGHTAKVAVKVVTKIVDPTGVDLSAAFSKLDVGMTKSLIANVKPSNATDKTLTWSTNNPGVATINDNGVVTAVSAGNATITATTSNGKKGTYVVTVEVYATGVNLNATSASLEPFGTRQLTPTLVPANTTIRTITWSSNNTSVAKVDANGLVTAVKKGTAKITARSIYGVSATCDVTVATSEDTLAQFANDMREAVNKARVSNGRQAASRNIPLMTAAETRVKELEKLYSQNRPNATAFTTLAPTAFAQLISNEYATAESIVQKWMNTPTEKAKILDSRNNVVVGVSTYEAANGTLYWVVLLGTN